MGVGVTVGVGVMVGVGVAVGVGVEGGLQIMPVLTLPIVELKIFIVLGLLVVTVQLRTFDRGSVKVKV